MNKLLTAAFVATAVYGFVAPGATANELVQIPLGAADPNFPAKCVRPSVQGVSVNPFEMRVGLVEAKAPAKGILILLSGGSGRLVLIRSSSPSSNTAFIGLHRNNVYVRSRQLLAAHGYHIALVDAARDYYHPTIVGGLGLNRRLNDTEHLSDIECVIQYMRDRFPGLPVWLVGISRGSLSTARGAAELPSNDGPDGIVLMSTVSADTSPTIFDVALDNIAVPAIVIAHEDDSCNVTPPENAELVADSLTLSPRVKVIKVGGGIELNDECSEQSHHDFSGVEAKTFEKMVRKIEKLSKLP